MDSIKEQSIDLTRKIEEISSVSEPETFDTWTIITDSLNTLNKSETNDLYNENHRIEILRDIVDQTKIKYHKDHENNDELSDGISIISDSESAGRSSPIPIYSSENNNNQTGTIESDYKTKETLYEPSTSITNQESFSQTAPTTSVDIVDNRVKRCCQDICYQNKTSSLFTARNISIFFYLSASIAIIAFVGKMQYPEWGNTLQEEVINQRVDDLELQNNLLRAEIDILSKQMKYLETETYAKNVISDPVRKHNDNKNYVKKDKIKVWPGNGRIESTEIPKEALKMPHSCDEYDKNFDGVCLSSEYSSDKKKNSDFHAQDINLDSYDIKDGLKNIIIESIGKIVPVAVHENIVNHYKAKEKHNVPENKDNVKFSQPNSEINDNAIHKKQEKYNSEHKENNNFIDINESNGRIPDNSFDDKSGKRNNKKDNYKNKVFRDDFRNQEKKQHNEENKRNINNDKIPDTKPRNKYDSAEKLNNKENYKNNDFENDSKEKQHKKHNKKYKKNDDVEKSDNYYKQKKYDKKENDDWHENMMKNREEYRKQHNEKWKSDNWYMDRASGREEARIFEKDQQKFKKMRRQ